MSARGWREAGNTGPASRHPVGPRGSTGVGTGGWLHVDPAATPSCPRCYLAGGTLGEPRGVGGHGDRRLAPRRRGNTGVVPPAALPIVGRFPPRAPADGTPMETAGVRRRGVGSASTPPGRSAWGNTGVVPTVRPGQHWSGPHPRLQQSELVLNPLPPSVGHDVRRVVDCAARRPGEGVGQPPLCLSGPPQAPVSGLRAAARSDR